jgi:hypothetical protein
MHALRKARPGAQGRAHQRLAFVIGQMALATGYVGGARNARDSQTRERSLANAWRSRDAIMETLAGGVTCSAAQAALLKELLAELRDGALRLEGPLECPPRTPGLTGLAAAVGALIAVGAIAGGLLTLAVEIVRAAL